MQRIFFVTILFWSLLGGISCSSNRVATVGFDNEIVSIHSDGWELKADLKIPEKKGPLPIAVLYNKAFGDRTSYNALQNELAYRGIASLAVDLRGHGESTNLGRFDPEDKESFAILPGTPSDITNVHEWIERDQRFDSLKIAVVSASYSGEYAAQSARDHMYATAYVQLSPGSLSNESIENVDASGSAWLFIRAEVELPFFDKIFKDIEETSKGAEIWLLPGEGHATDLLSMDNDLESRIADWVDQQLH